VRANSRGLATHYSCEAREFSNRLTFHSKGGQQRSYLGVGALTGHYQLKHCLGFAGGEVDPVYDFLDRFGDDHWMLDSGTKRRL
jgi:hypothetical protein